MEEDAHIEQLPNLQHSQWLFLLKQSDDTVPPQLKAETKTKLMEAITKDNMLALYLHVCEELKWQKDETLIAAMKKFVDERIVQLDAAIQDATENLGESEVREAHQAKADFFARIGEKDKAVTQIRLTFEKTIGFGQKFDLLFTLFRIGLFWTDHDLIHRTMQQAKGMVEQGSDWDRKNRLKVYEAIYYLSIRQFKKAAHLLLDSISTFTAVELIDYNEFIWYTIIMSVVSLDRPTLKQKVINAPEVLAVVHNLPHLTTLMNSLYNADYAPFFVALGEITEQLKKNQFMAPHAGFFCKEMRILAYSQLLESYKSVQLESMATAFGVSVEFLDKELSRFIASGRLHCKIDKVGGIVETTRPDNKNAQYQAVIKQGDLLLNRVQNLSRVINL
mmetsp:Transcript_4480/g.6262  ORF Transcript_4480/g.6262 Transcript_4480/m.6262 type:complete len:390 (-) Transcript_4480:424-1593(-)